MSSIPAPTTPDPAPATRRTIDVAHLPDEVFGERATVWWGNTLMLCIETATLAVLLVSYFYLRMNFDQWPPPKVDAYPPIAHPVPDLGVSTLNVLLLIASVFAMAWTHRAAHKLNRGRVLLGLGVMFAASALVTWLRWKEFPATKFWWNDNAYASIVWLIIGMHLLYSLAGAGEFLVMGLWVMTRKLDEAHALDVTLAGIYWYWVAGTGVVIYLVVYWGARVL